MKKFRLQCVKCHRINDLKNQCNCNQSQYYNFNTPIYDYAEINQKKLITFKPTAQKGLKKYLPILPNEKFVVTLGEGNTPILHFKNLGNFFNLSNLYVKNEAANPLGCFKDRGTSVAVNLALEANQKQLVICSSGNAAASASAYSNLAGIPCTCFISQATSNGKKKLIEVFGAKFEYMNEYYAGIYRYVVDKYKNDSQILNITAGVNIFKEEGNKTIAFEIFEDIGVPDKIIVPIGNGSLCFGIYKGFWELKQLGIIDSLPQIFGVQIKGNSPIAEAIDQKKDFVHLEQLPKSIAEGGIAAQSSFCAPKVIEALKQTNGKLIQISDEDLVRALKLLIKFESFIIEPTSIAPFAALEQIKIKNDEKVVCVATGNAFKNLEEIFEILKVKG